MYSYFSISFSFSVLNLICVILVIFVSYSALLFNLISFKLFHLFPIGCQGNISNFINNVGAYLSGCRAYFVHIIKLF